MELKEVIIGKLTLEGSERTNFDEVMNQLQTIADLMADFGKKHNFTKDAVIVCDDGSATRIGLRKIYETIDLLDSLSCGGTIEKGVLAIKKG